MAAITSNSKLSQYFETRLHEGMSPEDSKSHNITKLALQIFALSASFLSNPLISAPTSSSPSGSISGLLTYSNYISFSFLTCYSFLGIFKILAEPLGKAEWELTNRKTRNKVSILFFSVILGIFAKTGAAYLKYTEDNHNLFGPLTMALVDSWLPMLSTAIVFSKIFDWTDWVVLGREKKRIAQARTALANHFKRNGEALSEIGKGQRNELGSRLIQTKGNAENFQSEMLTPLYDLQKDANSANRMKTVASFVLSLPLTVSLLYTLGYEGYQGYLSAGLSTKTAQAFGFLTSAIYTSAVVKMLSHQTFYVAKNLTGYYFSPSLSDKLGKKSSLVFKTQGIFTAAFAYQGAVSAAQYFFPNKTYMEGLLGVSTCVLVSLPLVELIEEIIERVLIKRIGNPCEKELMMYKQKMEKFAMVVKCTPLPEVARYLKGLTENEYLPVLRLSGIPQTEVASFAEKYILTEQLV